MLVWRPRTPEPIPLNIVFQILNGEKIISLHVAKFSLFYILKVFQNKFGDSNFAIQAPIILLDYSYIDKLIDSYVASEKRFWWKLHCQNYILTKNKYGCHALYIIKLLFLSEWHRANHPWCRLLPTPSVRSVIATAIVSRLESSWQAGTNATEGRSDDTISGSG